jgi:aldehyde:ferredoxin oxidoreductase
MTGFPYLGYMGKLLRVDLSSRSWRVEPLDPLLAEGYLGGRGLAARILYDEVPAGIEPLSPANKLLFLTGPLVGTVSPSSGRYSLSCRSPLTGLYLFTICSGLLGGELKQAGYDGLIIEGRADEPSVLRIVDGRVEIVGAGEVWGRDTVETQAILRRSMARWGEAKIACIGPAGERQSRTACVLSELRAAGRGGPGAVMGSKNLKAVAVIGSGDVRVHHLPGFMDQVREAWQGIAATPFLRQGLSRYGSAITVGVVHEHGIMPSYNWQQATFDGAEGLLPRTMRERAVLKDVACPTCTVGCSKICRGTDGSISEGPEYETVYAFGSQCGIGDIHRVVQADMLCDLYGLDTISAGVTIGWVMECVQRGLLGADQLDGLDVRFGRGEVVPILLRKMAEREGVGAALADGVEAARIHFGIEDTSFSMHAKGMELGGYDPRGVKGQALVFSAGPRGGCHHAGGYVVMEEVVSGKWDRFANQGKGAMVRRMREFRMVIDSAIYCAFQGAGLGLEGAARLVNAATGMAWTVPDLLRAAERSSNVERAYNVRLGIRRSADTLPRRLLAEPIPAGPSAGQTVDLEPLLDEFYADCGWDGATGIPTAARLHALGLDDVAADLAQDHE